MPPNWASRLQGGAVTYLREVRDVEAANGLGEFQLLLAAGCQEVPHLYRLPASRLCCGCRRTARSSIITLARPLTTPTQMAVQAHEL